MGKKVDLNKPRNSGANLKRNNYHPNFLNYNNNSNSSSSDTENQPKEPNAIQKKAGETALRAAGVPKEAAKTLSNYGISIKISNDGSMQGFKIDKNKFLKIITKEFVEELISNLNIKAFGSVILDPFHSPSSRY